MFCCLVPEESANPGIGKFILLPENHFSICKPKDHNDRSYSDSFKVGSTVQYRCSLGHIVQGQSLRTCETTGLWSDAPPICVCKFVFFRFSLSFYNHFLYFY